MTPAEESSRVDGSEPPQRFDPELDPHPPRHRRRQGRVPRDCQRLVANPFLALLVFLGGLSMFGQAMLIDGMPMVPLALGALATVALSIYLLHYHCLDCGKTGWLFRWRYHCCAVVADRQRTGTGRLMPGMSPVNQTLLWTMLMCVAVMVVAIVESGVR